MKRNEGATDRIIRTVVGIALIVVSFAFAGIIKIVLIAFGAVSLMTAITGFCLLYTLFGIDTRKRNEVAPTCHFTSTIALAAAKNSRS